MDKLHLASAEYLRDDIPEFGPGDTVDVFVKIREGDKERVQLFEGVVLQVKGAGIGRSFTVRKISNGIGVERIFPLHSPVIEKIVRKRQGRVRRSKLFFLRDLQGKAARIREKKQA